MESRTTRSGKPLPSTADVNVRDVGEGDHGFSLADKITQDAIGAVTIDNDDVQSEALDALEVGVNSDTQVMATITPVIKGAMESMETSVRQALGNVEDVLIDARRRDAEEMGRAVSNTIGPIFQNAMDTLARQQNPNAIGHIVSDALGPVLNRLVQEVSGAVRHTVTDLQNVNGLHEPTTVPDNNRPVTHRVEAPGAQLSETSTANDGQMRQNSRDRGPRVTEDRPSQLNTQARIPIRPLDVHQQRRQRSTQAVTSDSEHESSSDIFIRRDRSHGAGPRLPPFTGKEDWKVWSNRFEDLSRLQSWSRERKLIELLPRLQGVAGEFVYGQLPIGTRHDVDALLRELGFRFRRIETTRTFGSKFSNRAQKPGESVEDFAAELTSLYDKAYPNRDGPTRREDLLRKFLDGLFDERTRMQVEFVKEPTDIDEAVYEVVNFQDVGAKHLTAREEARPPHV
jgi:hypothetical protein